MMNFDGKPNYEVRRAETLLKNEGADKPGHLLHGAWLRVRAEKERRRHIKIEEPDYSGPF